MISNWIVQANSQQRYEEVTLEGRHDLWTMVISAESMAMANESSALIRDRDTRKALKKLDLPTLAESATSTFNLLSTSGILNRLQISDIDGTIVFSTPQKFQGKSKKKLISAALKSGKLVHGLERDDDGKLFNVLSFPLSMRGKLIGAAIYEKNLIEAINLFKQNNQSDVYIVDTEGNLDYTTDEKLFSKISLQLQNIETNTSSVIQIDDFFHSVVNLPIKDNSGNIIATMYSSKDVSTSYTKQNRAWLLSFSISILIGLIAIIIIYYYMNHVLKPLTQVISDLKSMSEGDLSIDIDVNSNDEIGQLQQAMQSNLDELATVISNITNQSQQLVSSASDISQSASFAKVGAEQEQKELQHLTSAITQMNKSVLEVTKNSSIAASSTEKVNYETKGGKDLVDETIVSINTLTSEVSSSMEDVEQLRDDSVAIGAILDVIGGIAEQTNLLALNAAIEAARAGEQGRGFAVVADEVRSLAARTQQSTEEIRDMIERLQSKVTGVAEVMMRCQDKGRESVALAEKSGKSLYSINDSVIEITDMNLQIATASEQHATVCQAIDKNATSLNEISESAFKGTTVIFEGLEQLSNISSQLEQIINRFQLKAEN